MNSSKKPDGVAWDEENEAYIAKLLPYATSNSSPVISVPNVDAFKQKGVEKVSKQCLSLPIYPELSLKYVNFIGKTLNNYE